MRLPVSRARAVLIGVIVLAVATGVALGILPPQREAPAAGAGPAAIPVVVANIEQRDVSNRLSSIGTVQSLHTVVIRPQITGVLTEVMFREGDIVEKHAPLARIDDRSIVAALAQAEADKSSREAQLRVAELDLSRYASLVEQHIVSRQQMDQQAALVERLKADIRGSEANIAVHRVQRSFTHILSPVRGRVGIRRVDPGNLIQAGDPDGLVTVTQIDPISILFTLPQEALARLHLAPGTLSRPRVTAFDRDAGTPLAEGRLTTFDNQIDVDTGTLRLRAEFDNRDGRLWPGQFVALTLETGVSARALVFPARAVQQGLNGAFVFRIRDARAEVVPIVTTYQDDEIAVVTEGLSVGEAVVVDGQSRLRAGSTVAATRAAESANVTGR